MEFFLVEKIIMGAMIILTIVCVAISLKRRPRKLKNKTDDFIKYKEWVRKWHITKQ